MTAPGSGGRNRAMGSAARGAALVGVAVVLGIILLQVIDDGPSGGTGNVTTDTSVTTATSTAPTDTTAADENVRPRDQVKVLVLNGSNQNNVATLKNNALLGLGYQLEPPNNTQLRQGSVVACKQGFLAEVARLSKDAGPPDLEIIPFPDPAPTGRDGTDVGAGNVNCVVILGEA